MANLTQVFELRSLLPDKLVYPAQVALNRPGSEQPQKIASLLRNAASTGSKGIKQFKADYQSDSMRNLWQDVNSSDIPQGQDVWTRDYRQVLNESVVPRERIVKIEESEGAASQLVTKDDADVISGFKSQNPSILLESIGDSPALPLMMTISGTELILERQADDPATIAIRPVTEQRISERMQTVLRIIKDEHPATSLEVLLPLLASYTSMKTLHCHRCGRQFDASLQLPIARKRKESSEPKAQITWLPCHKSCLG